MAIDRRKADTRHKIALGGLIIKAGLGGIDPMALLGLLVSHAETIKDPGEQQMLRQIGRECIDRKAALNVDAVAG